MPRYCAVKVCRNRGVHASRQESKRISFYPFPLQDKPRLQKWVDNMNREKWTPSRHQFLCSEHFTEDCFDIRWGIRYLKNTAIPTIFPPVEDDSDKKSSNIKRSPKARPGLLDSDIDPTLSEYSRRKKPLILSRTCKKVSSNMTTHNVVAEAKEKTEAIHAEGLELPLAPDSVVTCHSNIPEPQTAKSGVPGDTVPTAPCLALTQCHELHSDRQADSTVTVLCCESLGSFEEVNVSAAEGQTFSFVPVESLKEKTLSSFLEERRPSEGENICVYEHSYCRSDMSKDQLWNKILSLHSKILELDHREECTVARIHALETEIALLKRDGAVFKEKQNILKDYISSVLL
ncbi:THAP domain-containing protein 5-like [Sphaeramia orbicularis]|uniref:THAP domain-containing protein 5-like n=1 Tax=Sphaeramia orbicularis TaxID=375764 RepID=UPI00117DBCEB|nr:THAP domain-containing protein 5 [Sphaeramia orbicularis]